MKIIGLCGGSAAGKGTVADMLRRHGVPVLDTDALYHEMIAAPSPCAQEIIDAFGKKIQNGQGGVDRQALSRLVFAPENRDMLLRLNEISHRHILKECKKWEEKSRQDGCDTICYDAPLLFESGLDKRCDCTVAVLADDDLRINRIVKRDGITRDAAHRRLQAQPPQQTLRDRATYCIENNGDMAALAAEVTRVIKQIRNHK